ncbi:MAG: AarF/ABC1/UbiB kinase family protein, partial [Acidobacteriota bacterium]
DELREALSALQTHAQPMPFDQVGGILTAELGDAGRNLLDRIEPQPVAAASIGQVHRGVLCDGRQVAVKIQYPEIDRIVRADLKNLRRLLQSLFALFSDVDFAPVWREVRDRLLEEIDYRHEAANMRRMAQLLAATPEIIVPRVVDEASTRRVLTMEFTAGVSPDRACSERYPQQLRDKWGCVLFEFQLRGLFQHRLLHADPNLANFSFLEDGRIIVYDFGCVKEIPEPLRNRYAELARAGIAGDYPEIPRVLERMGVVKTGGYPLDSRLTTPYVELIREVFRPEPPYRFGEDQTLYERLFELGLANWTEASDIEFPEDIVFIDRSLAGHFGNLGRLRATGPWRELLLRYAGFGPSEGGMDASRSD